MLTGLPQTLIYSVLETNRQSAVQGQRACEGWVISENPARNPTGTQARSDDVY